MTWWLPSTPETMEPYPWLHPAAVCYFESLLTKDMTVVEHGCGGSTLWLASRVKQVFSFDDNREWIDAIKRRYFANVVVGEPTVPTGVELLFIDGNTNGRATWLMDAHEIVKRGGIVVLDNAERPMYKEARQGLAKLTHPPTVITAWTGLGKMVMTEFYRLRGGENWI